MKKKYINRIIEKELLEKIKTFPVLVLTGPRQTGKSTMLKNIFPKYNYISLDDPLIRNYAQNDPKLFLETNKKPLIIDEIQYAPELLPYIKIDVDNNRNKNGLFILTGSQVFNLMTGITESLAGRCALYELFGFSIETLLTKNIIQKNFNSCYEQIFTGFFPDPCIHKIELTTFYNSYIKTYIERDLRQIKTVHDLRLFQNFFELLAARIGSILNLNEISKECGISNTTARNWLSLFESTRIIYLLRSYQKNITKRVIKNPKLYFTDTGLLSYLLKYPNAILLQTSPIAGHIFENMLVIEILKYKINHNKRFELYFFRDSNHNELDLILDFGYKIKLLEIKLTKTPKKEHWKTLKKIKQLLNTNENYLISLATEDLEIEQDIYLKPWWKILETLEINN